MADETISLETAAEIVRAASKQAKALAKLDEAAGSLLANAKNAVALEERIAVLAKQAAAGEQKLADQRALYDSRVQLLKDREHELNVEATQACDAIRAACRDECAAQVEAASNDVAAITEGIDALRAEHANLTLEVAILVDKRGEAAHGLALIRAQAAKLLG